MGRVGRIQVWRNVIVELKDTYYRNAKTRRGTKRQERRKTAGYTGFQVCLFWIAAVINALIRFLAEFRGAFMCVCVCAGGQRRRRECSISLPLFFLFTKIWSPDRTCGGGGARILINTRTALCFQSSPCVYQGPAYERNGMQYFFVECRRLRNDSNEKPPSTRFLCEINANGLWCAENADAMVNMHYTRVFAPRSLGSKWGPLKKYWIHTRLSNWHLARDQKRIFGFPFFLAKATVVR